MSVRPDGYETMAFTYSGPNLATMTALDGTTTNFNYTGGMVSKISTGGGRAWNLTYSTGSTPDLTKITDPDTNNETFAYTDASNPHHVTSEQYGPLGNSYQYDSNGLLKGYTWGDPGSPSSYRFAMRTRSLLETIRNRVPFLLTAAKPALLAHVRPPLRENR